MAKRISYWDHYPPKPVPPPAPLPPTCEAFIRTRRGSEWVFEKCWRLVSKNGRCRWHKDEDRFPSVHCPEKIDARWPDLYERVKHPYRNFRRRKSA